MSGPSEEPSRSAHDEALTARAGGRTVLDLDYRPMFWDSPAAATAQVQKVLGQVTVAVGNREECEVAAGETDPDRAAEALLDAGVRLAVVKRGADGVLARTRTERVVSPPIPATPCNGLGAVDSFGGSLAHGLLAGWPLETAFARANAAGAIVASRPECLPAGGHRLVDTGDEEIDSVKHSGVPVVADARETLRELTVLLRGYRVPAAYRAEYTRAEAEWTARVDTAFRGTPIPDGLLSQSAVIGLVNELSDAQDVVVCAAGSMPGDLHELWRVRRRRATTSSTATAAWATRSRVGSGCGWPARTGTCSCWSATGRT
ncbi:PfkB family carbohydrate kinase [Pseudonocardia sp. NPDC046786]|uniref:PfkB family carbohydrate kinase n=1 Tax=Pseudonocardia sp. NPDC046786 TaxID=3155471 RepID=UPI0033C2B0D5